MLDFINKVVRRRRDDRGASGVEYGLLVAAIAAVIVVIVVALGGVIRTEFDTTCDAVAGANQSSTPTGCTP